MNRYTFLSAAFVLAIAVYSLNIPPQGWSNLGLKRLSTKKLVADLIVKNGVIFTGDSSLHVADSMAVQNGRILRVGNYSSLQDLVGIGTKEVNVEGKVVVPGFIDSHVHFISGGLQMVRVELRGVNQKEEFVRRVKEAAGSNFRARMMDSCFTVYLFDVIVCKQIASDLKQGSWVLGGGWNNDLWGGELPMASWLDDFTAENPVWLTRMDGHMGLANSLALKLAGINNSSNDPNGGTIAKSIHGEPSGLLIDAAMELVLPWIPEVSVDERREAFLRVSNLALMRGVTTVVDFGRYFPGASVDHSWEDLSADVLVLSLFALSLMKVSFTSQDLIKKTGRALSNWIYLGGVKAFADGSLGSNSALFIEPYVNLRLFVSVANTLKVKVLRVVYATQWRNTIASYNGEIEFRMSIPYMFCNLLAEYMKFPYADEPHNYGLQVTDPESLFNMVSASDKFGLQVAIHAIGDKANEMVLDMYKSVALSNGKRDRRFRIEHAQHLVPGMTARFGEQGIVASVQPDHLLDDAESAAKKLGVDRAQQGSYLFRSLLASNARLALGSDWPVANINPVGSIKTAIKRVPPGWKNAWTASECLSLNDALIAHTISAAYACFLDNELGSLSPGKLADFVILSTSTLDDLAEGSVTVEATYVGGEKAYP
ncbi:unnamed protein product [Dovyalis caffra]|uniref:Amidohydrolase 3 domain-containing protein n=1 Tax=Dovyalis caffra TaxID=77055 RepID=A0AAV1RMQ6_9ROSI|nr:unnamed protein product [Dovyalis caffra]